MRPAAALRAVKIMHTVVWALLAASIVAIPLFAWRGQFAVAWVLIGVVLGEVAVLALNGMRCPLTNVAARYTDEREDERRDNFDIYLPVWLARWNKVIFGALFVLGLAFTTARWWTS